MLRRRRAQWTVFFAMPTLHSTHLSANGRKPLAVARHLAIDLEVELVDVYRGEGRAPRYLARHPLGQIPLLVDAELTLSESNAILLYLSETYGNFRLYARTPQARADIARWMFWEASQWQPSLVVALAGFVGQRLKLVPATPPIAARWDEPSFVRQARFSTRISSDARSSPAVSRRSPISPSQE